MTRENALNIYTDGSCLPKPRRGGIGIRFIYYDENLEEHKIDYEEFGYKGSTNNEMELLACITALKKSIKLDTNIRYDYIIIFTDSQYVISNYKNAIYNWPKNKWYKSDGNPVLNADLWKELVKWIKNVKYRVEFEKVKAHSKDQESKVVDKLAKASARSAYKKSLKVVNVRRKKSKKSLIIGSVIMNGQRLTIRIITSQFLRIQKINKYKYEVMSKRSKYFQNVDIIYTEETMKVGHSYLVTLNKNTEKPRIVRIITEASS